MTTALTAITASAALSLLTPPTRRYLAWAGPACVALVLASSGLILLTSALMLSGDWATSMITGPVATAILFPALWLARSPAEPPDAFDDHDDTDDDSGGGGGPPPPPRDPDPGPPAPELDWDAFNEARDSWVPRERELAGV